MKRNGACPGRCSRRVLRRAVVTRGATAEMWRRAGPCRRRRPGRRLPRQPRSELPPSTITKHCSVRPRPPEGSLIPRPLVDRNRASVAEGEHGSSFCFAHAEEGGEGGGRGRLPRNAAHHASWPSPTRRPFERFGYTRELRPYSLFRPRSRVVPFPAAAVRRRAATAARGNAAPAGARGPPPRPCVSPWTPPAAPLALPPWPSRRLRLLPPALTGTSDPAASWPSERR